MLKKIAIIFGVLSFFVAPRLAIGQAGLGLAHAMQAAQAKAEKEELSKKMLAKIEERYKLIKNRQTRMQEFFELSNAIATINAQDATNGAKTIILLRDLNTKFDAEDAAVLDIEITALVGTFNEASKKAGKKEDKKLNEAYKAYKERIKGVDKSAENPADLKRIIGEQVEVVEKFREFDGAGFKTCEKLEDLEKTRSELTKFKLKFGVFEADLVRQLGEAEIDLADAKDDAEAKAKAEKQIEQIKEEQAALKWSLARLAERELELQACIEKSKAVSETEKKPDPAPAPAPAPAPETPPAPPAGGTPSPSGSQGQ